MKIYVILESTGYNHTDVEVIAAFYDKEQAEKNKSKQKYPGNCHIEETELLKENIE